MILTGYHKYFGSTSKMLVKPNNYENCRTTNFNNIILIVIISTQYTCYCNHITIQGIGRKVLEKQGWKEGQGLGSTIRGIADALDNEGQVPSDKRGIGLVYNSQNNTFFLATAFMMIALHDIFLFHRVIMEEYCIKIIQ